MSTMQKEVPVVDVHKENFKDMWPSILLAVKTSTFIAMDLELSGLGDRKVLMSKSIDDRYKGICDSARTRSILSIGISCFKLCAVNKKETTDQATEDTADSEQTREDKTEWDFMAQTYNITCLCDEDYVVEPGSLKFLVEHGFDFNKQYAKGVPYYRGNDKNGEKEKITLRNLFVEIVQSGVPVAFHNGLVDLMFLYQNFWAALPSSSPTFLADLTQLFAAGVFDTKFITDYEHKMPASYLEYVFRKCMRTNTMNSSFSTVRHPSYPSGQENVSFCNCESRSGTIPIDTEQEVVEKMRRTLCDSFAGHGWCSYGNKCPKSHDVDLILDFDQIAQTRKSRKRKRRKQKESTQEVMASNNASSQSGGDSVEGAEPNVQSMSINGEEEESSSIDAKVSKTDSDVKSLAAKLTNIPVVGNPSRSGGRHRAGFDAFMTGYIMSTYVAEYGDFHGDLDVKQLGLDKLKNSLYLSGKDYALTVSQSSFTKNSKDHREKFEKVQNQQY